MSAVKDNTVIVLAIALELTKRTLDRLEATNKVSTVDPEHNIQLSDAIRTKQIADALVAAINS